jgi:2-polyprenyl-3-methyl-5-hydroxy-6-metoxy-1,4-benzoquinol methylase
MEPNAFVSEVYRRMAVRAAMRRTVDESPIAPTRERIQQVAKEYRALLPENKDSPILDIGYGDGWFMAACRQLGYRNVCGADFGVDEKKYIKEWGVKIYGIPNQDIGELLRGHREEFDFIHMSHVVEHISKYSLLWVVDALYQSLKRGGTLYLRTPNMEGPTPNSSYYVTLAHEYGFCGSNLKSLLDICGFDDVRLLRPCRQSGIRQKLGALARWPFLLSSAARHRLFGVNYGRRFESELIVTARRRDCPPFFDEKYR